MTSRQQSGTDYRLTKLVDIRNPFRALDLPLVVQLYKMAYHTYRKRWAKRLFKRPSRLLFDFAYHTLRLQGTGKLEIRFPTGKKTLNFNGRNGQFGGIYNFPPEHVFEAPIVGLMEALLRDEDVFVDVGAWGVPVFARGHSQRFSWPDSRV